MKITPVAQHKNNANFKGASSISKYSEDIQKVIKGSIQSSFSDVLLEATNEATKEQSVISKFLSKFTVAKKAQEFFTNNTVVKKVQKFSSDAYDKAIAGIAAVIGKAANTDTSKKFVETLNHFKKPSARMADLASFAITFFYVNNTRKSKKIEEERKMPLMVNNIAVTAVSSTMAALIDKGSDVILDRVKGALCLKKGKEVLDNVVNTVPDITEKIDGHSIEEFTEDILKSKEFRIKIKDYAKRFEKAKSLTVFSITVRFLVTVLMVPVAGKLVKIIKEYMAKNNQNSDKTNSK